MKEKKKILVLSDSPLVPSGVGTQTKYVIDSLIKTGEFKFFCLAGAVRHQDYRIQKVQPYDTDWMILPVDGYGTQDLIRQLLREYKPDLIWFMTDPRFYVWLWEMENEIRKNVPMMYYHVWDNFPDPMFNKKYYDSNDIICTISKVTDTIVKNVSPNVESVRIPHTVNPDIFCKKEEASDIQKRKMISSNNEKKTFFFWNNRNARRKQSGSLIYWFKDFLDIVGHDQAVLIMHTEPKDPNGQDLVAIMNNLGLTNGEVLISEQKMSPEDLACIYSAVDCTVNISDAEGFGLATLESLACETPVIVSMTGGLQEQVTDGEQWFGYGIEPVSKAIIGSQDVPYIYEDRIDGATFTNKLVEFHNLSKDQKAEMGKKGREHVLKNYGFEQFSKLWYETVTNTIEKHGSWEDRKNYKHWNFEEL